MLGNQGTRQVRITGFDNEPLAKLAEQRLRREGIPCFTRSLRGGPALWGSAYNLPHDLYVYEYDELLAREVLDLAPAQCPKHANLPSQRLSGSLAWLVLAGLIVVAVILAALVPLASYLAG